MCPSPLNRSASPCAKRSPSGVVSTIASGVPRSRRDVLDRREKRLRLQHHPGPAAKRHVVDDAVPVGREVAQVVHADVEHPAPDRPPDDPFRERRLHHRREDA